MSNKTQKTTVETQNLNQEWDKVYNRLCVQFFRSNCSTEFEISLNNLEDKVYTTKDGETKTVKGELKVLRALQKIGALKYQLVGENEVIADDGRVYYTYSFKISSFNAKARTKSKKTNKEYNVFFKQLGCWLFANN